MVAIYFYREYLTLPNEKEQKPFGGITVVFGGDFCQILPVVKRVHRKR